jgi:hypothetical protein
MGQPLSSLESREEKVGDMVDDSQRRRRAGWLGWLAIGVFLVFWTVPVGLVIAFPPKGEPTHGEMALIGVAELLTLLAAVGLIGTTISTALAIWSLYLKRWSFVSRVALGLDLAAIIAVLIAYFELR